VVPVVDLRRRGRRFAAEYARRVEEITAGGTLLLGCETDGLEGELAAWARAPHAVAVSSGAAALQLALSAIGVGAGDEVIVPAFTAVPTAAAVVAVGAVPVFADVDASTAAITTETVAAARTPGTKAVVVVHLYGRPAGLPETDLPVIEDAAQAHGAISDHSRSAATAYSFYPTKNLGGVGDGGAVVTHDARVADAVRLLRVHGMTAQYVHEAISQNFRMSEVEAAWLRLVLPALASDNERRRAIAAHHRASAPGLLWHAEHPQHVFHLAVVRAADREATRAALERCGVGTAVHYPLALTQQPAYRHFATTRCDEAEAWARTCISVPCFPEMTDAEVETVGRALASVDGGA
jgi:dTDP-3-amino-3,4,6-trideoxy-alpha-D-glucose transaminase